jgi:hypothetical protein
MFPNFPIFGKYSIFCHYIPPIYLQYFTPPLLYFHTRFCQQPLMVRNNAVVKENGDRFRDTVALTVRGDGVDIPPFFILHTYKNAAKRSGRRCEKNQTPAKGMNNARMKQYVDYIADYVQEPSLLIMDRLSSHTAGEVIRHVCSKMTPNGDQLLFPILIPPKTAFLISPLDMGAIGAFKSHYYKLDRSTFHRKVRAMSQAWDAVSNGAIENICLNCGIVGEESLSSIRKRFLKEVLGVIPTKMTKMLEYYDAWKSGQIEVEGATRGRKVALEIPQHLEGEELDGEYWTKFGGVVAGR